MFRLEEFFKNRNIINTVLRLRMPKVHHYLKESFYSETPGGKIGK